MSVFASNYRRTLLLLWLAAALLLGLTWGHVSALVGDSRMKELANAERHLANLTRVSQEHANRTFRSADQVIRFVQSRYLEVGDQLNLADLVDKGVIDAEIFTQVGIIDARGILVLSNLPVTGKLDLSDREHFKVHVAADTGELFVSKPVLGRASGKWSIQLARRISRPSGEFAGVVVVSIAMDYFSRFYGELKLGSQGVVTLYGLDGIARVRQIGDTNEYGSNAASAPFIDRIRQGQLEGSYTIRSVVDGVERLYYFRKIPGYQLVVADGLDTQYLLANHNNFKRALWLQATIVSLLIVALGIALTRYLVQMRNEIDVRERARREIEERNEQLNAIFDLSPDGFVSFDVQRRVKYVSRAFTQLTGERDEQLVGLDEPSFSAWLARRCAPATPFGGIAALRDKVAAGKPNLREVIEIVSPQKRVLQMGLRCSGSDQVSQILYLRDVTHEAEVDHMKSEFLSTAAHELRTPMASILGFAEVLLQHPHDAPTQHEFLTTIYRQSQLIANILDELLDLTRIEARRDKDFRYTRVDLQDLLADLVKDYPLPIGRTAPLLDLPAQPLYLMADSGKLRQALLNVVSNAYKYSPGGGPVHIKAWINHDEGQAPGACIEITDHGIGMTPAQLARVCERFYRADTSGKTPGTGLGMCIVKEIIDLHQGQLSLDSTPGQGTHVRLCLPSYFTLRDSSDSAAPANRVADTRPIDLS